MALYMDYRIKIKDLGGNVFKNRKGFTLAEVVVAAGLLGVLSIGFMQITKNINTTQKTAETASDQAELRASIRMILSNERFCRVSLAGEVFNKSNIDAEDEGLDISLYFSNLDGTTRTLKKFNGDNNPGTDDKSKHGGLTLKSLKLIMNNPTGNASPDYANNSKHYDIGFVRAIIEKKVTQTKTREIEIDFDLNVEMSTNSTGETTILGCSYYPATGVVLNSQLYRCENTTTSTQLYDCGEHWMAYGDGDGSKARSRWVSTKSTYRTWNGNNHACAPITGPTSSSWISTDSTYTAADGTIVDCTPLTTAGNP